MKKLNTTLLTLTLAFCMVACGNADTHVGNSIPASSAASNSASNVFPAVSEQSSISTQGSKILVAYFSRMGNMNFDPNVDAVASATVQVNGANHVGNNKIIADMLVKKTGGDLFFIEQVGKYPSAYRATTDQVKEEQNSGARPVLTAQVDNMVQYNTVILAYPNWWGTLPPAVCTFLETYDFSGKDILPLATHEGSGLGNGPSEIERLCPDATLLEGLSIRGSAVADAGADIETWLVSNALI